MPDMKEFLQMPIMVGSLTPTGKTVQFEATAEDLVGLAHRHHVQEVKKFAFHCKLTAWKKSGVKLKGRVCADIVQECVVSLAPLFHHIDEEIELFFIADGDNAFKSLQLSESHEIFLDFEEADSPEVFDGRNLDVGKIAEEFFELAIPAYPRCEDAEFGTHEVVLGQKKLDNVSDSEKKNDFSILSKLKK